MQRLCVEWEVLGSDDESRPGCVRNVKLCVDTYEYFFVENAMIRTNDLITYRGNTRSTERRFKPPGSSWFSGSMEDKPCEDSVPETNPKRSFSFLDERSWLAVEDEVLCWKPAVPVAEIPQTKENKDAGYTCYNSACWKMNDPAVEAQWNTLVTSTMFYEGWAIAGTGDVIFLGWLYCVRGRFKLSTTDLADVSPDAPQSAV